MTNNKHFFRGGSYSWEIFKLHEYDGGLERSISYLEHALRIDFRYVYVVVRCAKSDHCAGLQVRLFKIA